MEIVAPDPYPGRCRNVRSSGLATARCVDYEGTEHVCSFPDLKSTTLTSSIHNNAYTLAQREPVPWVKPE